MMDRHHGQKPTLAVEDEKLLLRRLLGELSEAQSKSLELRLENDAALARRLQELEAVWSGLASPPEFALSPDFEAPSGFVRRIVARAQAGTQVAVPLWIRAAAAAALVLGVMLGVSMGSAWRASEEGLFDAPDLGIAEVYLEGLEVEEEGEL